VRDRAYALTLLRGPRDWWLLARVSVFAAAVPALLRLSLPRLATLLVRPTSSRAPDPQTLARLERVVTLAPRIAHPVVRSGCLTRGLTLYWFLRRAGLDVQLHFGLESDTENMRYGHCWLTLDGEPYLEQQDPRRRFTDIYQLTSPATA
jgi:hypothetical protein